MCLYWLAAFRYDWDLMLMLIRVRISTCLILNVVSFQVNKVFKKVVSMLYCIYVRPSPYVFCFFLLTFQASCVFIGLRWDLLLFRVRIITGLNLSVISFQVSSVFIGLSPELELALYTICVLLKPDDACTVSLGGKKIDIRFALVRLGLHF